MNVPVALVIQSVPFAGLAMATLDGAGDLFTVLYVGAAGLVMSSAAWSGDHGAFAQAISAIGRFG